MAASGVALRVQGLTRAYGRTWVLRGLTFTVPAGQRLAVLGSNGAGKTTLLRVIATLLRPNAGSVVIGGYDITKDPNPARRLVGFAGHQPLLYDALSVQENLAFYAKLYRIPEAERRLREVLDLVRMTERAGVPAAQLSHGQRQRVSLARALLHDPPLLILDEPDTGLDAAAQNILDDLVLQGGRTVMFTTHNADRALRLADRMLLLQGGLLASDAPPQPVVRP